MVVVCTLLHGIQLDPMINLVEIKLIRHHLHCLVVRRNDETSGVRRARNLNKRIKRYASCSGNIIFVDLKIEFPKDIMFIKKRQNSILTQTCVKW